MADSVVLVAQTRTVQGTRAARRLRKQGLVPAVIYGHKEKTVAVTLPVDEVGKVIRHGIHVVDVQSDQKVEKALIREVQWDHLGKEILHVDFARVAADERIVVSVPLEIRGTPQGIGAGAVLDQPMHSLAVECLAISIPESIRVNVGELQIGHVVHVRDLVLPPGVKPMADGDAVVVQLKAALVEAEAPAAPVEAAEQAEPEVIGRQRVAEEEGEE